MDSASLFFNSPCNGNMFLFGNTDPIFQVPRSLLNIEENSKKRHFFCSPDDLIDEEYYDERMPEKKRRLTSDQVLLLEKSFEAEIKLEPERKTQLARELGLQPRQVAVWFQNRRARWKTKQLEIECENLKSDFLSLSSAHESILKENEKLKSVVVSLTEKLQAKEVAGMAVVSQKSDPLLPALEPDNLGVQMSVKVEDRLSCGSGGSAVVDGDGLQLVDSGDSYFPDDDYQGCMGPVDGVQSEGDDGGGDGQAYFSTEFLAAEQQNLEAGEALGLWGWS